MMKRIFFAFISLFCLFPATAQEKLGIANSNYSSTNSIYLNPSSSVDSRTYIQVNLVGLNAYAMNNAGYIPSFSVWSAAHGEFQEPQFSTLKLNKFVYSKMELDGPAVVVSNREIGIGFFVRGRAEIDIRNVPYSIVDNIYKMQTQGVSSLLADTSYKHFDLNAKNLKLSEMAWVEYGFNFGKMIFKHGNVMMTAGGNVKYLTGINVAYAHFNNFKAHVDDKNFDIERLNATVAYNTPGWNTGQGGAVDLGFTYKKTLKFVENYYSNSEKSGCKFIDYRYKIGVSLLDLGVIRFVNHDVFTGDISGAGHLSLNNIKNRSDLDTLKANLEANFNTKESYYTPIWAVLPTALSVQADWNMSYYLGLKKDRHFYVNTTAVQALTIARAIGVQRSSLISVAPRFEIKSVEIAMPLTFQRYIYPQLGFAFRIKNFVLGFDNVIPLVVKNNTYGASVYFNIGISIDNHRCRSSKPRYNAPKTYAGYTFNALKQKPSKNARNIELTKEGEQPSLKLDSKERTKSLKRQTKESKKKQRRKLFRRAPEKL